MLTEEMKKRIDEMHEAYSKDADVLLDRISVEFAQFRAKDFEGADLVAMHAFAHSATDIAAFIHSAMDMLHKKARPA